MPSTFSPALRLELIGNGEQAGNWGNTTNTNLGTLLEQAVTGVSSIAMLDANYTLISGNGVSDEARNAVLVMTGTLTATRSVIVPTSNKFYAVRNATTGSQSILVRTSAGTGVTLANGFTQLMYCDGTNVVLASVPINSSNGNISTGGSITATGGFVGNLTGNATTATTAVTATTATTATTANNVSGIVAIVNGGTGATTAGAARTALGSTTVGDAVFTAANGAAARTATGSAASGPVGSSDITMNTSRLLGRTTAGAGAIEEITVGAGLSFSANTLASTATAATGTLINVQVFTSSGTYTRTAGVARAVVVAVGGGGGSGGSSGSVGGTGGTTSFGSHVSAAGGLGGSGPAVGGAPGVGGTGGTGALIAVRGAPGITANGGGAGGGMGGGLGSAGVRGGGGSDALGGGGGGQGETATDYITSVGATETVTIGAGGVGGLPAGAAGGAGYVIVYEYS